MSYANSTKTWHSAEPRQYILYWSKAIRCHIE